MSLSPTDRIERSGFTLAAYAVPPYKADAPWLLLSNSLGASAVMWEAQLGWLSRRFRVLAYDTRGHGHSAAPDGPYALAELAEDAVAVLDHFAVDKAHLLGLSLGGMTALAVGLDHAGRVSSVVCCDARADNPEPFVRSWDERIEAVRQGGMAAILDGTFQRWFRPETLARDPAQTIALKTMFLTTSTHGYEGCAEALKQLALLERLPALHVPTFFVGGESDGAAPPPVMRAMAERTPGASYEEVPAAAHLANIDNPAAFKAIIERFYDQHGVAPAD